MDYAELFTADHIAKIVDWLAEEESITLVIYCPNTGDSPTTYKLSSLDEIRRLISDVKCPEVEIFLLKYFRNEEKALDQKLAPPWVFKNSDVSIYLSERKNMNYYAPFRDNPDSYRDSYDRWCGSA